MRFLQSDCPGILLFHNVSLHKYFFAFVLLTKARGSRIGRKAGTTENIRHRVSSEVGDGKRGVGRGQKTECSLSLMCNLQQFLEGALIAISASQKMQITSVLGLACLYGNPDATSFGGLNSDTKAHKTPFCLLFFCDQKYFTSTYLFLLRKHLYLTVTTWTEDSMNTVGRRL